MPYIQLDGGLEGEITDGEIVLTDEITEHTITLTMEAWDQLAAALAAHRSKKP